MAGALCSSANPPSPPPPLPTRLWQRQCSVGVIGAGAAGLVAARELLRQGHSVVIYEQSIDSIGGTWCYYSHSSSTPHHHQQHHVHSSMYLSLRTNLPREIMGFLDFPFLPCHRNTMVDEEEKEKPFLKSRDPRRYPHHREVLSYLQDFAHHFDLLRFIRFGRRVTHVHIKNITDRTSGVTATSTSSASTSDLLSILNSQLHLGGIQWCVESEAVNNHSDVTTDILDAVVVCNGHYFQPKFASIPGIEKWPGKQSHSHNYRVPDSFSDQVVVVIGNSSSGMDISRELALVAKEVHWAARTWPANVDLQKRVGASNNINLHPMVISAQEDGHLGFEDGTSILADTILYCTGYGYSLPFLHLEGIVNVDDDHIGPLYQHVYPPLLAPFLSFVGIPFKVIPFPLMELQSKWIAMALSGKLALPSSEEMKRWVDDFYDSIQAKGLPKSKIHDLSSCQFEYDDWLANECGCETLEIWRRKIYANSSYNKRASPDTYRDEWDDQDVYEAAMADLLQLQTIISRI